MKGMKNMSKGKRIPTISEAVISLILVIGVIVLGIRLKIGTHMALFLGASISCFIALYLKNPWKDIQDSIVDTVKDSIIAIIIIMITGMTVGVWMKSGTVPSLIYYGLKLVSPKLLLPTTFVLCCLTSVFTGTSYGSIATMGLAMVGVGMGMGIPAYMVAGAAVSGSFFGDKMSPMSDTTNMAPAMAGTTLYEHIGSMLYSTTIPTIICFILYTIIGLRFGGESSSSNIQIILDTLDNTFNISIFALIPLILVLAVSIKRIPAILGLGSCALISMLFAMFLQKVSFIDVMVAAFSGPSIQTGEALVDSILSRGGISMVSNTILLILIACVMGGALNASGIFITLVKEGLIKAAKNIGSLVVANMLYCYAIVLLTGNQVLGIILGGPTFRDAYKELDVHPKVLSRTLEDTSTIIAPLVPWSTAAAYTMGVLGVGPEYILYAFLGFIVPINSIVLAFTGFGMWKQDGTPYWKKTKGIAPTNQE
jgi:NhaC family Na+:H+ antiporter